MITLAKAIQQLREKYHRLLKLRLERLANSPDQPDIRPLGSGLDKDDSEEIIKIFCLIHQYIRIYEYLASLRNNKENVDKNNLLNNSHNNDVQQPTEILNSTKIGRASCRERVSSPV